MDKTSARRATLLIMALFVLQPLAIGGWLALIPHVKETLELSKGELALAILGMPLALIPFLQIAGRVIGQYGPRRIFMVFFPIQAVLLTFPLLAPSGPALFGALAVFGAMVAFLEVGINAYAGRLEKRAGVMIMNRCHGFWSLGLMLGSAFVALSAGTPMQKIIVLGVVSAVLGVWAAWVLPRLPGDEDTAHRPRRRFRELPPALLFVAGLMLCVTLTEGAMADWAAVHLAERLGDLEVTERAGIAVTIFAGFMAGGRFLGDWLKRRMGPVRQARMTSLTAIAGILCIVLPLPLGFAYAGYALVGFGVSSAYPLGVSAIAALDDRYESANIAIMAMVALGGFLIGPPLIGGIAEFASLDWGLAALLPGLFLSLYLAAWLRPAADDSTRIAENESPARPAEAVTR